MARDEVEKEIIAYVFSRGRSGETPVRVLADTIGKLLVDGYSGYDQVTVPGGRERGLLGARTKEVPRRSVHGP